MRSVRATRRKSALSYTHWQTDRESNGRAEPAGPVSHNAGGLCCSPAANEHSAATWEKPTRKRRPVKAPGYWTYLLQTVVTACSTTCTATKALVPWPTI